MIVDLSFGGILRMIRQHNKLTLRKMCVRLKIDPGNYSKLERGILPPPCSKRAVLAIVKGLDVSGFHEELLLCAAINFHQGKLQERFK